MLKGTQIQLDQLLRLRYYADGIDLSRCKRVTAKNSGLRSFWFSWARYGF